MVRKPPSLMSLGIVGALAVACVGWTILVQLWKPLSDWDAAMVAPPMARDSGATEIASAVALLTWPGVVYAGVLGVAIWAAQHRLRQLAVSLVLTVALAWGGAFALKLIFARPRPEQALDLLTTSGWSYPSGHMVAATAASIAIGATFVVTRQSHRRQLIGQVCAGLIVIMIGIDRWITSAHFISDLVGGLLFGAFFSSVSLVAAGVTVLPTTVTNLVIRSAPEPVVIPSTGPKRCAVVYNPAKVTDWVTFRRHVDYELRSRGWARALWMETTEDDPGYAMTARAVEEKVDLVLGAGGDGTIRVVCAGLAGTGIPFGLIPAGTGNLLARNIGIPLDEGAALDVAFDGVDRPIDLVKITVDDSDPDYFAVMAGIGLDAVIMQGTNPDLKKAVGSAAYFVSAAQNANHPAVHATFQLDDQPAFKRRAHVIVVGNVGFLQGGIPLIPDAKPDDGLLDVLIASPRGLRDWVRIIARVMTRQRGDEDQLDRLTGRKITITVEERDQYQLDGDTAGECSTLVAEVQPGALTLRTPRSPKRDVGAVALEDPAELVEEEEKVPA